VEGRITHWWADDSHFVVREDGIAEGVFAVALLKDALVANSFGREETEGVVLEDRGISLRTLVDVVLKVTEDYDTGFGSSGVSILVCFDDKDTHGGNGLGNFTGSAQREILFLGDGLID